MDAHSGMDGGVVMFLVSQKGHVMYSASAFLTVGVRRASRKEIIGVTPSGAVVSFAEYDCKELAELDFNLLKKGIEQGDKIFYFSKEVEEK